jgi:hypothetical protein
MAATAANVAASIRSRNDRGVDRPQRCHAVDRETPRTQPLDARAASDEHFSEHGHIGLERHVLEDGRALGQARPPS